MDILECATCHRMWRDTDGSWVCPNGHENEWDDNDDYGPAYLRKVVG